MSKRSIKPQRGFFPQPVYLIGCFKEDGSPNFTLKTWITYSSTEPPIIMFTAGNAHLKKTATRILEAGVFSANLVTVPMIKYADYCGVTSGHRIDKCADAGISWGKGNLLDIPVLDDSPWVFECEVVKTVQIGNGTVFFGEIKNILADDSITDITYGNIDILSLNPAIYAPGNYYSIRGKIFSVGDSLKGVKKRPMVPGP